MIMSQAKDIPFLNPRETIISYLYNLIKKRYRLTGNLMAWLCEQRSRSGWPMLTAGMADKANVGE